MEERSNRPRTREMAPKVSFEVWYSQREKAIPAHHHREILKADFGGQGITAMATMAEFDKALNTYGVKLG